MSEQLSELKERAQRERGAWSQLIGDRDNYISALEQRVARLEREACTCPWPEDAVKTRHLLSCRLMQMEHEVHRAEEEALAESNLSTLTNQQKPTEEAMEEV